MESVDGSRRYVLFSGNLAKAFPFLDFFGDSVFIIRGISALAPENKRAEFIPEDKYPAFLSVYITFMDLSV